jgi:tRNA(Arg) A34 adenosine deaminase TadA
MSVVKIYLPKWIEEEQANMPEFFPTLEERMREVIRFSQLNIDHGTGGPFAAGIFESKSGRLVVIGVNRVVPLNCSSAHAEIVAMSLAQKKLGVYDLGGPGMPEHQLVVNWLPCSMCFGALLWSGIKSLVVAGTGPELENITGFDEGPIHPKWLDELGKRGIEFVGSILTEKAIKVFKSFAERGELVYNSRLG